MKDTQSLSHTSFRCKYHIVIIPKYRRMVIYNKLRKDIGQILRMLCERKPGVQLLEAEACPDHIHMLLEIPPKYSISEFMGYLKSKSTLMIFERHANMKYKYGNKKFWARGYFVDTVGRNEKAIREYIQNQLQEDKLSDQMTMKEFIDPFTGEPVKKSNKKAPLRGNWNTCCGCQASIVEGLSQHHALIGLVDTTNFIGGYDIKKRILSNPRRLKYK